MPKQLLRCDICGGNIEVQAGGKSGICANCGASYSLERMREIYSGKKVSITGTIEDVTQWKSLVRTYIEQHDFSAAEGVVKKILEAVPTDSEAHSIYKKLQSWKYYDIRNGILMRYSGSEEEVIIPEGIIGIHAEAFSDYRMDDEKKPISNIRKIIMPQRLLSLPSGLFSQLKSLVTVVLPISIMEISDELFYECESLQTLVLPTKINRVGKNAFYGCRNLKTIEMPEALEIIGEGAFSDCTSIEIIKLPDKTKEIGAKAFYCCRSLKMLEMPESLETIGELAFCCTSIVKIRLPACTKEIGAQAFAGCTKLKAVHLPQNLKTIEDGIFSGCTSLEKIEIPSSIEVIKTDAFHNCKSLINIDLPEGLITIQRAAFAQSGLKKIDIPESVKSIGDYCFSLCSNLKSVHLNENNGKKKFEGGTVNEESDSNPMTFNGCPLLRSYSSEIVLSTSNPKLTRYLYFKYLGQDGEYYSKIIYVHNEKALEWQERGLCDYCGGTLENHTSFYMKGVIPKAYKRIVCTVCGRTKNY